MLENSMQISETIKFHATSGNAYRVPLETNFDMSGEES